MALDRLARYCDLLQQWNQRVNLTAITETGEVYLKHFLDSLTLLPLLPLGAGTLIDVGTGGGFPGLPLAIARPGLQVTLLEAHARKTTFLDAVVADLGLDNVTVLTGRAEDLGQDAAHREHYDVSVTRAVDALGVLAEYQLPLCRPEGVVLAMKKGDIEAEVAQAGRAITTLGGHLRAVLPVETPGLEGDRTVVVLDKVAATPPQYPRRTGMPAKRPLR